MKIAIVEDEKNDSDILSKCLNQYSSSHIYPLGFTVFRDAKSFLFAIADNYDLVFMDIELPDGNGMELATEVRKKDANIIIIFITNMAQYAIKGYSVNAMDFLVKPVNYSSFVTMFDRAVCLYETTSQKEILIKTKDGVIKTNIKDIFFIDVISHRITFHLESSILESWGNLASLEEQLSSNGFQRGNNSYLINLSKVIDIKNNSVALSNGEVIPLSRSRKKQFAIAFSNYIQGS